MTTDSTDTDSTNTATSAVPVALGRASHPADQLRGVWPMGRSQALEQLERRIAEHGLVILGSIDTTGVLGRAGLSIPPISQVLAFHPRYMRAVLETDPAAIVEAPLKLALVEQDGVTDVRCVDPALTFGRYPGLEELGATLHTLVTAVVAPDPADGALTD